MITLPELTPREQSVLDALCQNPGDTNAELAASMGDVGEATIKRYLSRLFEKYGVKNRTELFAIATQKNTRKSK